MTPKEKADELLAKYTVATWIKLDEIKYLTTIPTAKQCALIAVDELINDNDHNETIVNGGLNKLYWQEVKQEIEKL